MTNINRKKIAYNIYKKIGFTKLLSENIVNDVFLSIVTGLKLNKKIKISKFGTFIIKSKNKRIGRNPKTLVEKIIPERKIVSFYPSKYFKKKINLKNYG